MTMKKTIIHLILLISFLISFLNCNKKEEIVLSNDKTKFVEYLQSETSGINDGTALDNQYYDGKDSPISLIFF